MFMKERLSGIFSSNSCSVYLFVSDGYGASGAGGRDVISALPLLRDAVSIGTDRLPRRGDMDMQDAVLIFDLTSIADPDQVMSHFALEFPEARCVGIFNGHDLGAYRDALFLKAKYGKPHGFIPIDATADTTAAVLCVVSAGGEVLPWSQPYGKPIMSQAAITLPHDTEGRDVGILTGLSQAAEGDVRTAYSDLSLTARETQVLRLLTTGMQNKVMANELGISENTVRIHIHHILRKLGVRNRTEAANAGIRSGLFAFFACDAFPSDWLQILIQSLVFV